MVIIYDYNNKLMMKIILFFIIKNSNLTDVLSWHFQLELLLKLHSFGCLHCNNCLRVYLYTKAGEKHYHISFL